MANIKIKHAKIDRENGHYICVYKIDAKTVFKWDWQGNQVLTLNDKAIGKRQYKTLDAFEGWCMRYCAENDI